MDFGHTVRTSIYVLVNFVVSNSCISFNIGPINTKLENAANLKCALSDYMGLVLFIP